METQEIINAMGIRPTIVKTFNREHLLNIGKISENEKTIQRMNYVVYKLERMEDNNIGRAIEKANNILSARIEFLREFYKSGGECYYYLWVYTDFERKAVFELSPETLRICADLGVKIGAEIHSK
jgi:hypothetical protein